MPQFQMLDAAPDFGSQLGQQLGAGLSQGIGQSVSSFFQMKQKQEQTSQILDALGISRKTGSGLNSLRKDAPSETAGVGTGATSKTAGSGTEVNITPEKVLAAAVLGDQYDLPHLGSAVASLYESQNKQELQSRKETFSREQAAEPELQKINSRLRSAEQSGMRFGRLEELFSPELEDKFPPTWSVGLLTKDGELTPFAQSQLSPEAQETIKLVTDELQGVKDTFGSQITGFEVKTYLKRLPGLLNSAEGKRRVLRDIKIINELNQMHDQGILDIVDREGGPGKISLSKAEQIFRNENKDRVRELREEFVNPNKKSFKTLPDPKRYQNRKMYDPETGQILRSNGTEWLPEKK